jgi:cell division protein FtsB
LNLGRPAKVVLYAAFVGLLLASYLGPLQEIQKQRQNMAALRAELELLRSENASTKRETEDLGTTSGLENAARERYGMVYPGEKVYIVPDEGHGASGLGGQQHDGER